MPPRKLNGIDTQVLEAELKRRRRRLPALQRKHAKLAAKISAVEDEMAGLGGAASRRGGTSRTRPRNEMSLVEAIGKVLKTDTPMTIGQVIDGVQKLGYRSNAANFRTIVNQALIREKQFKKKGRGQYLLAK